MSKKTTKTTAVALSAKKEVESVDTFITQAIGANLPVETMERLFALRKEVKAELGKEAFDIAMSKFQGECPIIKKTKEVRNKQGSLLYKYAPIESIVAQTKLIVKNNGFSYAILTETTDKGVKVTCRVKHELGHSEASDVSVPLGDKTDIMSQPQVVASALTFAKRYAFCNAFGILTGDDDTDGKIEGKKSAREAEVVGAQMTTAEKFQKAKVMIQALSTKKAVMKAKEQVEQSEIYDQEQKDKLVKALMDRMAELSI